MRQHKAPQAWAAPARFEVARPQGRMIDVTRARERVLSGPGGPFPDPGHTQGFEKRFADLDGLYGDAATYRALLPRLREQVVYEVWEYHPSEVPGDLVLGVCVMQPGRVGAEYFMTRGHRHTLTDSSEVYWCLSGKGVMLLEDQEGAPRALPMEPGAIVYVPPHWIHRTVNVGTEPFVAGFCYAANAGHDYAIVARSGGLRARIVTDDRGGWKLVPEPR